MHYISASCLIKDWQILYVLYSAYYCIQYYMHGSIEYHIFEYIILTAHLSEHISAYKEVLSRR